MTLYEVTCDYQTVSELHFMEGISLCKTSLTVTLLGQAFVKVGCIVFVMVRLRRLYWHFVLIVYFLVAMSAVGFSECL